MSCESATSMLCRPTGPFCRSTSGMLKPLSLHHIFFESCFVRAMVWGRSWLSAFSRSGVPVSAQTEGGTLWF